MDVQRIDIAGAEAGPALARSLRETGFAVLSGHALDAGLLARLYARWGRFFGSDEKYDYRMRPSALVDNPVGFVPADVSETAVGGECKDLKEFYQFMPGEMLPPALAADTLAYLDEAFALGARLLASLYRAAPAGTFRRLEAPLDSVVSRAHSVLRVLHYPPLTGAEARGAVRAAAHEDINLLTLLPVADRPGLELRDVRGEWRALAGRRGDVIVNAGDMLCELTAGYFPSTTHRVVNPSSPAENLSRLSMPYFLTPRLDTVLSARYTAGSYLAERLAQINR